MAEDQQQGRGEQPEDEQGGTPGDKKPPAGGSGSGYRLGGSGSGSPGGPSGGGAGFGSGGSPFPGAGGAGGSGNPFEAFFASLAGGDTSALAAQLQNAFAMLGGGGSMFGGGVEDGSGVNWEVTKDTAR